MSSKFQFRGYQAQQLWRSLAAGLFVALCGLVFVLTPVGDSFERNFGLHWLFKMRGSRPQPPDVAVVGINNYTGWELSLLFGLLSREPVGWPRTVHARLIDRLVSKNAQGIVFDFDFSLPKPGDENAILAQAIKRADRVILFESMESETPKGGVNGGSISAEQVHHPPEVLAKDARAVGPWVLAKLDEAAFQFWTFKSGAADTPTLPAVALQFRALTVYDDWLTVLRKAHAPGVDDLPARADEVKSPDDVLQLMQALRRMFRQHGSLREEVVQKADRLYGARSDVTALITALAALYTGPDDYFINFYGPPGTIRYIPYESLLTEDGNAGSNDLSNAMVFVGRSDTSHADFPDHFYTSFTKDAVDLSGVEIMATAYANLLSGRTLTPSPAWMSVLAVVAFGLLAGFLAYFLPPTLAVPAVFAVAALYTLLLWWRFDEADLWLPLATPWLVQLPAALLIGPMGQYLLMRRMEEQLKKAIGYYLPESLVRDLAQRQVDPTTLNREVFGTCLATDMSDFMSLGESKLPAELAAFMNKYYFDPIALALKRHGADVMEFRADMIMCAWIAPQRSAEVCRKGMEAAIEVSEIITRFAQNFAWHHFTPRVGLHDGDVYVGHTGGGGRFLYSIVGDTANTAARLESLNKHLGTHVLAAESVVQEANGLLLRNLGLFRLKGKAEPTSIFEILGRKDSARAEQLDLCAQFAEGLATFQRKEWLRAASLFEAITRSYVNDGPSRFYWACSQKYAVETPMYDGPAVIQMNEK